MVMVKISIAFHSFLKIYHFSKNLNYGCLQLLHFLFQDSKTDFTGCAHHDKTQGEPTNRLTLLITSEDVNHKNTGKAYLLVFKITNYIDNVDEIKIIINYKNQQVYKNYRNFKALF